MSLINNARLPRIGGMATMPSRTATFGTALASILPQVDRLFIFFDKYTEIPDAFLDHPKITQLGSSRFGNLGPCGKFLGIEFQTEPALYFCFDDDILYPPNYVEVLASALFRHHLRAVVGVHATWFRPPHLSYRKHRHMMHFTSKLDFDCYADELGTGTLAFCTETFHFDPRTWPHNDMPDLTLAIETAKQGLSRVAIRRPAEFVKVLAEIQDDSMFARLSKDDTRETAMMCDALNSYPLAWHHWGFDREFAVATKTS